MQLRTITALPADLTDVPVLVRASLNVPLTKDGTVRNRFRVARATPTLRELAERGARVTLISHIGRESAETLRPVYEALAQELAIQWGGSICDEAFAAAHASLGAGEILMAENLRQDEREQANDPAFAAHLAQFGEYFVNDAFAEVHRPHASLMGVTDHLTAYAGRALAEEVRSLEAAMAPRSPSLFLLGGAKFDTKFPLIDKYLRLYDHVFIGGALANDVFKARGYEVGRSLTSEIDLTDSPLLTDPHLLTPIDVVVDGPAGRQLRTPDAVGADESILDCGPETVAMLEDHIARAQTVLWNGPFGNYEGGYTDGTEDTCRALANSSARVYVGGGDTVAAIATLDLFDRLGFVSVGGGAMLAFLEAGSTPVLETLRQRSQQAAE